MSSGGGGESNRISHESGLGVVFFLLFFLLMGSLVFGEGRYLWICVFPILWRIICFVYRG